MSNELRLSSEKRLRLFTGRGYPELADEVASELGIPITPHLHMTLPMVKYLLDSKRAFVAVMPS
jgi:hypothetical protein